MALKAFKVQSKLWIFSNDERGGDNIRIEGLSPDNRKGGILKVNFSQSAARSYDFLPTYVRPDGTIQPDSRAERTKEIGRLTSRLRWPRYSFFWRAYSIRQEWRLRLKPLFLRRKISWQKVKEIRIKHFRQLLGSMRRSAKITLEKLTNPYE